MAKALCFRACADCKSAVECDPDKTGSKKPWPSSSARGRGRLVNATKSLSILGGARLVTSDCR